MIRLAKLTPLCGLAALMLASATQAQNTITDTPPDGSNTECDYTALCNLFGTGPGNFIGGAIDAVEGIFEDEGLSPEEAAALEEENAREQKRINDEIERQRLAEEKRRRDEEKLASNPELGEALTDFAEVENGVWEQLHRVDPKMGSFNFAGGVSNEDGSFGYRGRYVDGYIYGEYTLFEGNTETGGDLSAGTFAGAATRGGRVTGRYVNQTTSERGSFRGQVTPKIDRILSGAFSCKQNCDDD